MIRVAPIIREVDQSSFPTASTDQPVDDAKSSELIAKVTFPRHVCGQSATTSLEIGEHGPATLRSRDGFAYGHW
jgi:hypothetical protein